MNKPERKLNAKQDNILLFVYKFRYLTADNYAKLQSISHASAYSALSILTKHSFLGRKHNKSYRLQNKSARYYLTKKAINYLQQDRFKLHRELLAARRNEDKKSTSFVDHQVAICRAIIDIHATTQYAIDTYNTGTDMRAHDYGLDTENYLSNYPSIELVYEGTELRTLVEIIPANQHLFIAKKRIRQYIEHYDEHMWEWEQYPEVYFVVDSPAKAKHLTSYIGKKMEDMYLDEDDFVMKAVPTSTYTNHI